MIPSVFPTVSTTPYKVNTGIGSVLNINTYLKPSIPFLFRSHINMYSAGLVLAGCEFQRRKVENL